jgi:thiol:disulfide interchange protein DsbD
MSLPTLIRLLALLATTLASTTPALAQFGGADSSSLFGGAQEDESPEVTLEAIPSRDRVRPGDQLTVAVVMRFKEGWKAWPAAEQDVLPDEFAQFAIRTTAGLAETPEWIEAVGRVQWPEPKLSKVPNLTGAGTVEVPTYAGTAVAYLPLLVAADAALGERSLTVEVGYQACDESICLAPETVAIPVTITIDPDATAAGEAAATDLFQNFDASVYADLSAGTGVEAAATQTGAATSRSFFGLALPSADGALGILITALLAAAGGFILNLTPCVLPVIPIKIMAISQHASSPGKSLALGVWMSLGVVAFWVAIGLPVALFAGVTDPSRLFGIWWVTLGIGVIIAAMGVGIMGVFSIQLPQKVYAVNPKADTAWGSFVFGIMTAVLGLPCFGFVAGALLAGSATMPPALIMTIFTSLGVGMALPYLVLSAKPKLVDSIPRTGPASELVKQVMGLLLLAAAAYFIGSGVLAWISERPSLAVELPWWGKVAHWWAVALLTIAAGAWLACRTFAITKKPLPRAAFSIIALLFVGTAGLYAWDVTAKAQDDFWIPFTDAELAAAIEADQVVVIDFTAEWCLNCKALKAAVLTREPVKGELLSTSVTPMVADLTSSKAPGWEKLRALGQTGIPTLAIYGPGLSADQPWIANAYTSEQVMGAIERARGGESVASR